MIYVKETLNVRVIKMDLSWWYYPSSASDSTYKVWFLGLFAASLTTGIAHPCPILLIVSPPASRAVSALQEIY